MPRPAACCPRPTAGSAKASTQWTCERRARCSSNSRNREPSPDEANSTWSGPPSLACQNENRAPLILLMRARYQVAAIPEDERPLFGPFQADNPTDINHMVAFRMGGNLYALQVCRARTDNGNAAHTGSKCEIAEFIVASCRKLSGDLNLMLREDIYRKPLRVPKNGMAPG
ncbi:protein of unknown function (plasmid) [Cupriavidus taiwanensis]|uniref:Uncharacterized protein n=1 Tax=Cupriavidus taiwanensis TaxID=164546 RepID=A0A375IQD9_9BURK|nr:protein of unknown function [Cupriavidus taiwanensis]